MPQHQHTPNAKPDNNEHLQPFVIASLAAIVGFGYVYYHRGDAVRALAVGGVAFLILFWVILRGNKLRKLRSRRALLPDMTDTSKAADWSSLWPQVAVACSVLLFGISVSLCYVFGTVSDLKKTHSSLRSESPQDDKGERVRRIEFHFWQEISGNPHPSFADGVDAAVAALDIPIHSMEKNWPSGPTVVTFQGTAMDANKIFDALRSAGVPTSSYRVLE